MTKTIHQLTHHLHTLQGQDPAKRSHSEQREALLAAEVTLEMSMMAPAPLESISVGDRGDRMSLRGDNINTTGRGDRVGVTSSMSNIRDARDMNMSNTDDMIDGREGGAVRGWGAFAPSDQAFAMSLSSRLPPYRPDPLVLPSFSLSPKPYSSVETVRATPRSGVEVGRGGGERAERGERGGREGGLRNEMSFLLPTSSYPPSAPYNSRNNTNNTDVDRGAQEEEEEEEKGYEPRAYYKAATAGHINSTHRSIPRSPRAPDTHSGYQNTSEKGVKEEKAGRGGREARGGGEEKEEKEEAADATLHTESDEGEDEADGSEDEEEEEVEEVGRYRNAPITPITPSGLSYTVVLPWQNPFPLPVYPDREGREGRASGDTGDSYVDVRQSAVTVNQLKGESAGEKGSQRGEGGSKASASQRVREKGSVKGSEKGSVKGSEKGSEKDSYGGRDREMERERERQRERGTNRERDREREREATNDLTSQSSLPSVQSMLTADSVTLTADALSARGRAERERGDIEGEGSERERESRRSSAASEGLSGRLSEGSSRMKAKGGAGY